MVAEFFFKCILVTQLRIIAITFILGSFFISGCSDNHSAENIENSGLGFRPLSLEAGVTKLYIQDYLSSEVEKITWPDGLKIKFQKDSSIYHIEGSMKRPIGLVKFQTREGVYSLLLKQGLSKKVEIKYNKTNKHDSIYVFGSFNNWNRKSVPLLYVPESESSVAGNHVIELNLLPGEYEFKFHIKGDEVLLLDSVYDIVSNGQGGYNHSLIVNKSGEECHQLIALNIIERNIDGVLRNYLRVDSLPKNQIIYPLWNNKAIPNSHIERIKNGELWILLPEKKTWGKRSHLHIYSENGNQVSNDILIPFGEEHVIKSTTELNRQDWEAARLYFLMVDRFSNGSTINDRPLSQDDVLPLVDYMGGDLQGVNDVIRENYFEDFGFNTVWLSPIGKNPEGAWGLWDKGGVKTKFSGYHGYWPISSVLPDKRLASKESIRNLLNTAHSRELNVLLDYVANHVHLEHPVYKQHPEWATKLYLEDGSINTEQWDSHRLTTWFDNHLPTLDLRRPEVVEPMTDSALIWIRDYGFDGFRHDATKHVDILYWRTLTKKIKNELNHEKRIFQIGETYGSPQLISSYLGSGLLDAQFDFNLYDAAVKFFGDLGGNSKHLADVLETSLNTYGYHHLMGNISGNQDKPRFISLAGGAISFSEDTKLAGYKRKIDVGDSSYSYNKLALLHAFNHAIPGVPIVYYGDEYGIPGANDPDNRRMMKFKGYSLKEKNLRNTVFQIVQARKHYMALNYGFTDIKTPQNDVLIITRRYLNTKIDIVLNNGNNPFVYEINSPFKIVAGKGELGLKQVIIPKNGFVYLAGE